MALLKAYSVKPLFERIFPAADPAESPDTVALTGGGFATVADVPGGFSVPRVYDAAGKLQPQVVSSFAPDAKIAQLSDGTIAMVGTHSGGGIDFVRFTSQGIVGIPSALLPFPSDFNPDIAATAAGNSLGFVVASQRQMDGADHNINIYLYDDGGPIQFTVDASTANDQNAAVAGLADGGFAVAWERIDASGNSTAWYAVYNADGSVRKAPFAFLPVGPVNHQLSITATQSGGFAIGFENDTLTPGHSDIRVVSFAMSGQIILGDLASSLSNDDREAAVTTLSNGMVLSTFTTDILDGGEFRDSDIHGALFDPTTGKTLTDPANPMAIDISGDINSQSSVSALGLAQFVVSYSGGVTGDVTQRMMQLVRTVTGDASDDAFTGDDAVDVLNGLGGNDSLAGGANDDTISGGDGNDLLNGGAGRDLLNGGANNDYLVGGDGGDTLNGGTGADALLGGLGNDTYYVDNAADEVSETSAAATEIDTVRSSVSYALGANVENMVLTGSSSIGATGNSLANTITGNAGANILDGKGGADIMAGLGGNDTYYVDNLLDKTIEANGAGTDTVLLSVSKSFVDQFIDNITIQGATNINTTANNVANRVIGNSAQNAINGRAGNDTLTGGLGNDSFVFDTALGAANVDAITDFSNAAGNDDRMVLNNDIFTQIVGTGTLTAAQFVKNTTGLAADANDRIIYESDTGKLF